MVIFGKKINSDLLFRFIFHIVLWTVWIGLPIVNSGNDEKFRRFAIAIIPITLTNIPLFLANSEFLIPRIFRRKGVGAYLLSLLGLVLVFAALQMMMKEWLLFDLLRRHWDWFWSVVPVVFVTAISTGYGFIVYLLAQERIRREEQQERLQSELSFLRSQISPHFIFNILNSIVYLIRSRSALAEPVTIKLSELMRYMLYESEGRQVPLDREIGYLKNYVELQKIRFEEDVTIRMEVEGQAGSYHIEPMLMIPFVENAFKHGVGLLADPFIDISLKIRKSTLFFSVKNKVAPEPAEAKDASSGIGLRNVRRRLELLYPDRHTMLVEARDGHFTVSLEVGLSDASIKLND